MPNPKTEPANGTCAVADWPAPPLRVWPHRTPAAQGEVVRKHTGTAWAVPADAPASKSRPAATATQPGPLP